MKNFKKLVGVFSAVCLAASAISVSAFADEKTELTEKRIEDLNYLYDNLKAVHPDIFANTHEEDFLSLKADIEKRTPNNSDFDFALDLEELAALVGDSHTSVVLGNSVAASIKYYPVEIDWFNGIWYLTMTESKYSDMIGMQVTEINGTSMDKVLKKFAPFISFDNDVKLRRQFSEVSYVADMYKHVGIVSEGEPIDVTLLDSKGAKHTISSDPISASNLKKTDYVNIDDKRAVVPETSYDKSKYYFSKPINDITYYIQYNQCAEDENYSMADFCKQIKSDLDNGGYKTVLVDLRYNGGGSDGVIAPLMLMLKQEIDNSGLQVAALVSEKTFSSAIINAVEFQEMGCVLVGEETSGSIDHFGSVTSFTLPNSQLKVKVSTKYISLSEYFDAAAGKGVEPLVPDVVIHQTIEDYLAGKDTCVEKILSDTSCLKAEERDSAPLTRGRFIGELYKALGSPQADVTSAPYSDLFGFEWYFSALSWAKENNIASGTGDGYFSASKIITWQEAAVFLSRAIDSLGIEPSIAFDSHIPESLLKNEWSREYVENAWGWGLIPHGSNFSSSPTRADGKKMIETLINMK